MKYTLAFDVYGTLIDTSGVFNSLETIIGDKATAFMNLWRNKQLEYSFRRAAMKKYVDFSICTKEAMEYCCLALRVDLKNSEKDTLMNAYKVLPAFLDVAASLENLKEIGHRLFAFSNGSSDAVSTLLEHANIIHFFEGIVSVADVKMFKPSPVVYQHFNTKTNSSKLDSWLISGNPFDVMGAISHGMRAVWVQRSSEAIFDPWGIHPTATITGLVKLKSVFDKSD
ncbi:MAG: haloacid dehalogenase type II [Saonia sp.]